LFRILLAHLELLQEKCLACPNMLPIINSLLRILQYSITYQLFWPEIAALPLRQSVELEARFSL